MASTPRTVLAGFNFFDQWIIAVVTILVCSIFCYVVYSAVMVTASELLQRLIIILPLLLVITVHWLSSDEHLSIPVPGSEPVSIHGAGGSPWGVAFVLVLVFVLIRFQSVLNALA